MGVGVHIFAFLVKDSAVGAFFAADEDEEFVVPCEGPQARHAVGYLSANGIVVFERRRRRDMRLDIIDDLPVFLQRLGRLGIKSDIPIATQIGRASCRERV